MRFLVADDERLARYSLRSMLEGLGYHPGTIMEAENGQVLAEKALRHRPDCAFVDIRMPVLDGLSAIERAALDCPDTLWVVVTSYSDFDYAKKALRLQAFDYLVKPVAPEELAAVVQRAAEVLRRRAEALDRAFEAWCSLVVSGKRGEGPPGLGERVFGAALLLAPDYLDNTALSRFMLEAGSLARGAVAALARVGTAYAVVEDGASVWIVEARRPADLLAGRDDRRLLLALGQEVLAGRLPGPTLAWGTGTTLEACLEAVRSLRAFSPFADPNGIVEAARLPASTALPQVRDLVLGAAAAAERFTAGDLLGWESAFPELRTLAQAAYSRVEPADRQRFDGYFRRAAATLAGGSLPAEEAQVPGDSLELFLKTAQAVCSEQRGAGQGPGLVDRVRAFLEAHYMKDVGVAEVASYLRLSPNYLSARFKREGGRSFTALLTSIRMSKARDLLATGRYGVAEVCGLVGYRDHRHFAEVYRKFFGTSPSGRRG